MEKLCDYFEASADYLLGRTNARTPKLKLKSVCEKVGLSDKSVLMLARLKKDKTENVSLVTRVFLGGYGMIQTDTNAVWNFPHNIKVLNDKNNTLGNSDKIFVSFRFDLKTHKSWVVLTGRKYKDGVQSSSNELLLPTPQIQLIGGVWSNFVAMRMLDGQLFVSGVLDEVYYYLKYSLEYEQLRCFNIPHNRKKKTEINKVDRCLYAPFLYLTDNDGNIKYMDFLTKNYMDAYKFALGCTSFSKYLEEYHDKDVEWHF